jgi:hypothetical protein
MTDHESRPDEEYEPDEVDPDNVIASKPSTEVDPPVEADRADWADQHREVPLDDDDDHAPE